MLKAIGHPRRRVVLAGVVVAAIVSAGVAYSSGGSASSTLTACVNDTNGNMRLVASAGECRQHESAVTWNAEGTAGPTGPTGPQGPTGAAGVSGYEITSASVGIGPGSSAAGTVPCPAGKHVLGGGWTTDVLFDLGVFVGQSGPNTGGTGWTGEIQNTNSSGDPVQVTLSAVCANVATMAAAGAKVRTRASRALRVLRPKHR